MHLASIKDRLNNPKLSVIEKCQREVFCNIVSSLSLKNKSEVLSVSCGDGIWDYLLFESHKSIRKIVATDVVPCPVKEQDQQLLNTFGTWEFQRVDCSGKLPFKDDRFSFIYHQDVIEHTETPFLFLKEQYRVLKNGGSIIVGTPNIFRPANIAKLLLGNLRFPVKIGGNEEIGDYIHVQEFHEQQLNLMLHEIGFKDIKIYHQYFGLSITNVAIAKYPKSNFGKLFSHFLTFHAYK